MADGIEELLSQLDTAARQGDIQELVTRLAPGTFQLWSREQCLKTIGEWVTPTSFSAALSSITDIEGPRDINMNYGNDRHVLYENTYHIGPTDPPDDTSMRLVKDGNSWYWLANCD